MQRAAEQLRELNRGCSYPRYNRFEPIGKPQIGTNRWEAGRLAGKFRQSLDRSYQLFADA